ncbi:NAD(P)-binding domain-containing protein [Streptomyces sp. NPDC088794]|uniref:NAD(P)-binding domain-containing protein n=1 Tax=Streptomyces sp. NPDC088794 TaxID=3365902 RepID=UPI0037F4CD19
MSRSSTVDLVVVGLGYVGLPLARSAAAAGLRVVGLDRNRTVVDGLNAGRSHVDDIMDAEVAAMLGQGFEAVDRPEVIAESAAVVICVPTPLTEYGSPDLGAVHAAVGDIAAHLVPGSRAAIRSNSSGRTAPTGKASTTTSIPPGSTTRARGRAGETVT